MNNLYDVLGVPMSSGDIAIKRAYRRLSFKHHPDTGDGDVDALRKIQGAYELLSKPDKKKKYDAVVALLKDQSTKNQKPSFNPSGYTASGSMVYSGTWTGGSIQPQYHQQNGPSVFYPFSAQKYTRNATLRIGDVISKGLSGLMPGDTVYVSTGAPFDIFPKPTNGAVAATISRVSYGAAYGGTVYADFEITF